MDLSLPTLSTISLNLKQIKIIKKSTSIYNIELLLYNI